jgi:hypothetical protein
VCKIVLRNAIVDRILCDMPFGRQHNVPVLRTDMTDGHCMSETDGTDRHGLPDAVRTDRQIVSGSESREFGATLVETDRQAKSKQKKRKCMPESKVASVRDVKKMINVLMKECARVCRNGATMVLLTGMRKVIKAYVFFMSLARCMHTCI